MVKQNEMEDLKAKSADKIDPDPFSLLLMILGALGSVASLLSYADSKREEADRREKRSRHRILDSITIAKNTMNSLRAKVELIEVMVRSEGSLDSNKAQKFPIFGRPFVGKLVVRAMPSSLCCYHDVAPMSDSGHRR